MNRAINFCNRFLSPAVIYLGLALAMSALFSRQAVAAPDEHSLTHIQADFDVAAIIHASMLEDLKSLSSFDLQLKSARKVCLVQLRDELLPSACFQVLQLEDRLKIHSRQFVDVSWIERLCETRARTITRIELLEESSASLPPHCRAVAAERADDLRYQQETEAPEKLFSSRFKGKSHFETHDRTPHHAITVR